MDIELTEAGEIVTPKLFQLSAEWLVLNRAKISTLIATTSFVRENYIPTVTLAPKTVKVTVGPGLLIRK